MSTRAGLDAQLQEALVMASMVALRNDLAIETGDWWAFNWVTNVITVPAREMATSPKARIAWIILHESAHAALTRFHEILPECILQRPEIHMLLNTVEDLRIEEWLVRRFPGSAAWRKVCRGVDESEPITNGLIADKDHLMRTFLHAVFLTCSNGEIPSGLDERIHNALLRIRPALQKAVACQPPPVAAGSEVIDSLYAKHPVSACYRTLDAEEEPTPFEKWVRITQVTSWSHILSGIIPTYLQLLDLEPLQNVALAAKPALKRLARRTGKNAGDQKRALRRQLANLQSAPYQEAVAKHADLIRQVSEVFAEQLPNHRGLGLQRGHRSGDRVDLRMAYQADADSRFLDRLWIQRRRRILPDPAFVFVMDRSGSMAEENRSKSAFASLVIVREACTRAGIPFAVVAFSGDAEVIHGWETLDDERARTALGMVLQVVGGTRLSDGLELAAELNAERPERDRFVFVLSDGDLTPAQIKESRLCKARIEAAGGRFAAVGLGSSSEDIRRVFPGSPLLRESSELPMVLSRILAGFQRWEACGA